MGYVCVEWSDPDINNVGRYSIIVMGGGGVAREVYALCNTVIYGCKVWETLWADRVLFLQCPQTVGHEAVIRQGVQQMNS
jgi:hypothetical protein